LGPTKGLVADENALACRPGAFRALVRIGGSRHPAIARASQLTLESPSIERIAKREARVVGWVEQLEGATLAFVKVYTQRPRRIAWEGFSSPLRACREFSRLCRLEDVGVPCTAPLFWGCGTSPQVGRVEVLATRLVEGARSLRQAIEERESVVDELPWHELLGSVDRMHAAGVHHGGLSWKNLLLDAKNRFYISDLARSMRYRESIAETRMALFDLVHFFHCLGKFIGTERCYEILRKERGDELLARVMDKAAGYDRGNHAQHLRLRGEFFLRSLWSWYGGTSWARWRAA